MKLISILAAALMIAFAGRALAGGVGFQELRIANGDDKPLTIGVWYPSDGPASDQALGQFTQTVAPGGPVAGSGLPLIVMSHGTGGWYGEHYDTSLAFARAGFVVAAVSHTGDTYEDQSRAVRIWERPAELRRLIDYMLAEWPDHGRIDAQRVGAFGFSAGGFTVLVAAGAVPDLSKTEAHCIAHPDYFDCQLLKRSGAGVRAGVDLPASTWAHDPRIRAAVVAAPALGYTFGPQGLKDVALPLQLWRAEDDHILPHPEYAEAVRLALPAPPEFHLVANADHFDFLAPCNDQLAKVAAQICVSRPGFDRTAFHEVFDREVVAFFQATLK
ncbi:MAG: alpha/beta hydrolase family protein [Caulobacterales bacterium]